MAVCLPVGTILLLIVIFLHVQNKSKHLLLYLLSFFTKVFIFESLQVLFLALIYNYVDRLYLIYFLLRKQSTVKACQLYVVLNI